LFTGLFLVIIVSLFSGRLLVATENKLKVGVLDFKTVGDSASIGEGAAEILRTTLIETGRYTIIERGMLNQVLEEQKLSLSGIVDPNTAAGIGKVLGAQLVAVGSVVKIGADFGHAEGCLGLKARGSSVHAEAHRSEATLSF